MVLKSADVWKLDDIAEFSGLNVSMFRRVHAEREVRALAVVIIEIARKSFLQVSFIQHDNAVQTLPANRANDSLRIRVLPWTLGSD